MFNDIADVEVDRAHPRKRRRPIASGAISVRAAKRFGAALLLAGLGCAVAVEGPARWWTLILVVLHVLNVMGYSAGIKRVAFLDVISLSIGFVLRVMAGCVAIGIWPSTWLLNVSLFLSMTLAIGKRLGERRALGSEAAAVAARRVQAAYSDDLLRMSLVVTAVATLLTYAGYVVTREPDFQLTNAGFNLLWVTILPAMYGLLRSIMLLETGRFDDPTELAVKDRPFQISALVFGAITMGLIAWRALGSLGHQAG